MNNKNLKKNFIWNFLGLTINSFNSFFFLVIINRINGQYDAGIFTYSFSLVTLLYFIAIYYSRTYQISNDQFNNKEYLLNRILSIIVMFAIMNIIMLIFNYNYFKNMVIFLIGLFKILEALADVFYGFEQKNDKLYKAGFSLFVKGILGLFSFLIVDLLTKNIMYSLLIVCLINLVIIIFYDVPNCKKDIKIKASFKNVFKLYKLAFPIFIFSFLNIFLVNSSKYFLDYFSTAQMQNIFGIILMPGTILSLISQYILNPFIVNLNECYKKSQIKEFKKIIFKISMYLIIFGLLAEIVCFLIGIPVLNLVYGFDLSKYKYHLMIIILGAIFLALTSSLSTALTIIGKNYIQMFIYILNSVLSIILSILLVKKYELIGATIVYTLIMLLQLILYTIFYQYFINKERKVNSNEK